jgi:hypothetical protein
MLYVKYIYICSYDYRFGDNFGLFKDDSGTLWVVWVTDFHSDAEVPGLDDDITIYGRRFKQKKGSWRSETFCMSSLHSYIVSDLEDDPVPFRKEQLVGKGTCFYLRQDREPRKTRVVDFTLPRNDATWLFELLDHCVDYNALRRRPTGPTRKKRKRSVSASGDTHRSVMTGSPNAC